MNPKTEIITKEVTDKLIDGSKSVADVIIGATKELSNEAVNLFIVQSFLAILKYAVVFVVFFVVKKYLDTIMDETNDKIIKSFKTMAICISLTFFAYKSFPHLQDIAKAFVAPNIFLAEKAIDLKKSLTESK